MNQAVAQTALYLISIFLTNRKSSFSISQVQGCLTKDYISQKAVCSNVIM